MEEKISKYKNLLNLILVISIIINVYQFATAQSVKNVERNATIKEMELISTNFLNMANNIDDLIRLTTDPVESENQDVDRIFSTWTATYSVSKEVESELSTINKNHFKSISDEILYLQQIMSITDKNLYTLNVEFLKKSSRPFKVSKQERETLEVISEIYRMIGNGMKIGPDISFAPGLFEKLIMPLKEIDSTGWWKIMEEEILKDK